MESPDGLITGQTVPRNHSCGGTFDEKMAFDLAEEQMQGMRRVEEKGVKRDPDTSTYTVTENVISTRR
jgi:hypothetical protein